MKHVRTLSIILMTLLFLVGAVSFLWAGGNGESEEGMGAEGPYRKYSEEAFQEAQDLKRVYFFHASWCPTCRKAEREIEANLDAIPEDVVIFKTNYDWERSLKKKYGVTSQHTYVYVDGDGEVISKWYGGSTDEIVAAVKEG